MYKNYALLKWFHEVDDNTLVYPCLEFNMVLVKVVIFVSQSTVPAPAGIMFINQAKSSSIWI